MSWLSVLPAFALVVIVLYLPGLVLALAVGARRFLLVAVAPAVSIAFMGVAAILFPFLGLDWGVIPVGIAVAVTAIVLWLVTLPLRRDSSAREPAEGRSDGRWIAGALSLAAIIIAAQLCLGIGQPDHISQTFDGAFHLNTLRFISEHGDGSSLHITDLILPPGQSSFYPAAWHDFVALGAQFSATTIPVAVNLCNIAVAAFVWPAGGILLARTLIPGSRVAIVGAGVLSAALPSFPLLMLNYGVLYPYFLALALLPIALAVGFTLIGSRSASNAQLCMRIALLPAVLVAIALSQPAVAFAWAACTVPLLIDRYVRHVRIHRGLGSRALASIAIFGGVGALAVAWIWFGRVGAHAPWSSYTNILGALFETLSYSVRGRPVAVAVGVLTVLGILRLLTQRDRYWILGMWGVAAFLFTSAIAFPSWGLRTVTVGLFYRDPPRLAALLAVVALPIAVIGLVSLWAFLLSWLWPRLSAGLRGASRTTGAAVGVSIALIVLVASTQGSAMHAAVGSASRTYALTDRAPLVSIDELALLDRLDTEVPHGSVVAGNPWTGTSFAYVVAGRDVLNPHFNAVTDPRAEIINGRLNQALTQPDVCEAVRDLNVDYVLDFGTYAKDAGETGLAFDFASGYEGLRDLGPSGVATVVDREGPAVLYRITACD